VYTETVSVRSSDEDPEGDWDRETELDDAEEPEAPNDSRALLVCRQPTRTDVVEIREGEQAVFGRSGDVTLRVEDSKASRRHVAVRLVGGTLHVEDLGSRNGTLVNGRVLRGASCAVAGSGVVRIGDCEIILATATVRSVVADAPTKEADEIVVADPEMQKVLALAQKVARASTTVLVLGETGVGKDVLARRIHALSRRRDQPFVRINCGAIPDALLESELFGHEKGAFTGADRRKIGLVEAAKGGTLFIDEIGELTAAAQVKLLHVLENRTLTRLGGATEIPVDVRIVCATHRDLKSDVKTGRYRADLFYRISSFALAIPPLRERPSEVVVFAHSFAEAFARAAGDPSPVISHEFAQALSGYSWPGNVRELKNAVEHAMVVADGGELTAECLPPEVRGAQREAWGGVKKELADLERERIERAIGDEGGNQTRAAARLGMSRRTLVYKLARWKREEA